MNVGGGICGAIPQIDDPFAGLDASAKPVGVQESKGRQVRRGGAAAVEGPHMGVIRRIRGEVGDQRLDECVFVIGDQSIITLHLVADCGAVAARGRPRGAKTAETPWVGYTTVASEAWAKRTAAEKGFVSVCDPAVGSGVMLLAFAKVVHAELGRPALARKSGSTAPTSTSVACSCAGSNCA